MKRIAVILSIILMSITSCSLFNDSNTGSGKRVARIGTNVLYESEIAKLMPEGVNPQDSIEMVQQYINSWALNQLMIRKAKSQLSKSEKNITAEIEEFKADLLSFRYEKLYIEERLDTVVTKEEIHSYYDDHINNFTATATIIKGRVLRISTNSPYYEMLKDDFDRTSKTVSTDIREHFLSMGDKYVEFADEWRFANTIAKEVGMDPAMFESSISVDSSYELDSDNMHYLVYICNYVPEGDISPLDYNEDKIKDIIISHRKQQLINDLERDVLVEATNRNKLKIYK